MTIRELQKEAHRIAKEKGFYENPPTIENRIALIHSEISEAFEKIRAGRAPTEVYFTGDKPEGFGIELADVVIRIADACEYYGIDLQRLVTMKMAYNVTRPYKHGKQF